MIVHDYGWANVLVLIGIILMVLGSFTQLDFKGVNMWNLGWAFVVAGLTSGGGYVLMR